MSSDVGISFFTANAEDMRLEDDGDLHVDKDVIAFSTTISDERLKENIVMYPHIEDLHKQLPGSIIVAYKQYANTSVHMHVDPATECSVNIVLSDDYAPVIFEDYGEIHYECALFNTSLNHAVPKYSEERLLLKFSFLDTSYDKVREMLNDKIR